MRGISSRTAVALALLGVALAAPTARAGFFISNNAASESGLGSFTGSIFVTSNTATTATITIQLTNTSTAANRGAITAVAFNDPGSVAGGDITSVTGDSLAANFDALGYMLNQPLVNNTINASPFGDFDLGASLSGSGFQGGGGNPNQGISIGSTGTFVFNVTGTNLLNLTDASLMAALSSNPSGGRPAPFLLVRFRGFADDGSDKVPAVAAVPEPTTLVLTALGGLVLLGVRLRRRQGV